MRAIGRFLSVFGAFACWTMGALAEDDAANGKDVYAQYCASCHGAYGEVSNEVIPNILGQYPGYVLTQLAAFASSDPNSARSGVAGDLKRSIGAGFSRCNSLPRVHSVQGGGGDWRGGKRARRTCLSGLMARELRGLR